MLSDRLESWNDTSVYKDRDGEIIPEILRAMQAIRRYKHGAGADRAGKQPWDL